MPWLEGWNRRKQLTIAATYRDLGDLTDFPVYVPILDDPDIGAHAKSDGTDLRFTLADGQTVLYHHRDYFRVTEGAAKARLWLREPSLPVGVAVTGYVYYDNPGAGDSSDGQNTWANHAAVWHLEESGNGTPDEFKDARGLRHGTGGAGDPAKCPAFTPGGKIGTCQTFDGSNDFIEVAHHASLNAYPLSVTFWCKTTATDAQMRAAASKHASGDTNGWFIATYSSNLRGYYYRDGTSYIANLYGGQSVSDGNWHLVKWVADSTGGRFYIDAVPKTLRTWVGTPGACSSSRQLRMGHLYLEGGTPNWSGPLDQVRVAAAAHNAAWAKFEFHNEADADNCLSWGAEQVLISGPYSVARRQAAVCGAAASQLALPGRAAGQAAVCGAEAGEVG